MKGVGNDINMIGEGKFHKDLFLPEQRSPGIASRGYVGRGPAPLSHGPAPPGD